MIRRCLAAGAALAALAALAAAGCSQPDDWPVPPPTVSASPTPSVTRPTTQPTTRPAPPQDDPPADDPQPPRVRPSVSVSTKVVTKTVTPERPRSFSSCGEMRRWFPYGVQEGVPEYRAPLDTDGNGWACEPTQ